MMPNTQSSSAAVSRRRFLATGLAAAATSFTPLRLLGATDVQPGGIVGMIRRATTVQIQPLRRNLSVLSGSGGLIVVLAGSDGKLLVDAGVAGSRESITAALVSLGAGPVRKVVNTHFHFDHTDGNQWLRAEGATIIAHEKTRRRMTARHRVEPLQHTFPPAPATALPTSVFQTAHTIYFNDHTVELQYCGSAHTDTDISVYFVEADVLHVGDTWFNNHYPLIDYSGGGHINGVIEAASRHIALATDRTIIVPGHGVVGTRAQLVEFHDTMVVLRDRITLLKQKGLTLDQVMKEKPTAEYDSKWGVSLISPDVFTGLVYAGV